MAWASITARGLVCAAVLLAVPPAHADLADCALLGDAASQAAFRAFDGDLRAALRRPDPAAVALLSRFPLQVNYPDGAAMGLNTPATLEIRFAETITPAVRAAVTKQGADKLFCRDTGIMYGNGELWIDVVRRKGAVRFAIATVNVPGAARPASRRAPAQEPHVEFVCNASHHRVIVDRLKGGALRYRAWNIPRALTEAPDLTLTGGADDVEGTSPCTHSTWTFHKGKTAFVVSELGCTEGQPPPNASGTLQVLVDDQSKLEDWCI